MEKRLGKTSGLKQRIGAVVNYCFTIFGPRKL